MATITLYLVPIEIKKRDTTMHGTPVISVI